MSIHDFTAIFYRFLLFIVFCVGIFRYKKLTFPFKILTWSALIIFLLEIVDLIFVIRYRNNAPIVHLEAITEYVFYSLVYYYLFKNEKIKKAILISIAFFVVFFFINALVFEPYQHVFPNNIRIPALVLFLVFSLMLIKEVVLSPYTKDAFKDGRFWYISALSFYFVTLVLIISTSIDDPGLVLYYFGYLILYIFHVLIGVVLLVDDKNRYEKEKAALKELDKVGI